MEPGSGLPVGWERTGTARRVVPNGQGFGMTTTFFLLRHAAHDNLGSYLAGRTPGICLGPAGRAQALRLAERMRRGPFQGIFSQPGGRARATPPAGALTTRGGPGGVGA